MKNDAKIIALCGKGSSGKSTTIKIVIEKLKQNTQLSVLESGSHGADEWCKFLYKNSKTLGITSRGDSKDIIEKDLKSLGECTAYICAIRTYGETLDFIKNRFADENTVIFGRAFLDSGLNCRSGSAKRIRTDEWQADKLCEMILDMLDM